MVLAPAEMVSALAGKSIAGFIVAEPFNAAAEIAGVGKVLRFSGDVWRDHACCVTFLAERDVAEKPEWARRVTSALVKAQLWTRDNRLETAQLLSNTGERRYTPHPPQTLAKVLAATDYVDYEKSGVVQHKGWAQRRIDFQHGIGQRLLSRAAGWCAALAVDVHMPGQSFGVVGVQLPQLGQLRAERDLGVAGFPDLSTVPLLGRTLDIQAVIGVEIEIPAQGARIVLGGDVGIITTFGNPGEYRHVGIRPLVGAFLGIQLPIDALLRIQGLAHCQAEAVEAAAVTTVGTGGVAVEAIVLLA